jgi:hypothetical protein
MRSTVLCACCTAGEPMLANPNCDLGCLGTGWVSIEDEQAGGSVSGARNPGDGEGMGSSPISGAPGGEP